ncbi:MAG: hypothetical protein JWQ43_1813 [Glaciihabitans sp.]|nr:hypothetical protein [Glaciihabitans sp.]
MTTEPHNPDPSHGVAAASTLEVDEPPTSGSIRAWRVALVAVGVALLVVGGITLINDVAPTQYLGILIWLAGALVLHDGIAAIIIFVIGLLLRRAGKRLPFAVIAIVQGALVVAVIATLVALPESIKKNLGTNSSSILPLDYGANLLWFYLGLAVVTAVTIVVFLRVHARRTKTSASA